MKRAINKVPHNLDKKASPQGFSTFIFQKQQLIEILVFVITSILVFIATYSYYPLPITSPDSVNYLYCAETGQFGGYRPYGYSAFIRFVGYFSKTTTGLFLAQFMLHTISALFFNLMVKFCFSLKSNFQYYLFATCALFSFSILHLTNFILSDSVFISLTLLWITSGIWILKTQSIGIYLLNLLLLLFIIQIRYSGLFYPIISMLLFAYTFKKNTILRFIITLTPAIVGFFIYYKGNSDMKKLVGIKIFSSFSGWQIANNALHIIPYVKPSEKLFEKNAKSSRIHQFVMAMPDSVYLKSGLTSNYMWGQEYPLKQYLFKTIEESKYPYLKAWILASVDFQQYGQTLIKTYPKAFFTHYIVPNAKEALVPSNAEVLENTTCITSSNTWFKQDVTTYQESNTNVFLIYARYLPLITTYQWGLLFLAVLLLVLFRSKISLNKLEIQVLAFIGVFMLCYLIFNIYASPFAMRYSLPLHSLMILVVFTPILKIKSLQNNAIEPAKR